MLALPSPGPAPRLLRTSQSRKINLGHFAFYRGWLEGLDMAAMAERYLPTGGDLPEAKKTLRWLQDELVVAAKRSRPTLARLLKLTPGQLTALTSAPPSSGLPPSISLDDFRDQVDPDGDFYSEKELVELFKERFSSQAETQAYRKAQRNERLLKSLRDTVTWLEGWVAVDPQLEDPVESWLSENIAQRLVSQNITTLADLAGVIQTYGATWHRRFIKIGPVAAARLERWMVENRIMGHPSNNLPAPALSFDIVPVERLLVPEELSGRTGTNRLYVHQLDATDDFSAIDAWLRAMKSNAHTQRNYRSQAERFVLWMMFERQKPLSSANVDDCIAYREFLNSLGEPEQLWFWQTPRSRWVSEKWAPRWRADWRPFSGTLAASSRALAVTILTAMFRWLCEQRYLNLNPWNAVSSNYTRLLKLRVDFSLSAEQWGSCLQYLAHQPVTEKSLRLRALTSIAFSTGMRLSELAQLKTYQPTTTDAPPLGLVPAPDGGWDFVIIGKGSRLRAIPVSDPALDALGDYWEAMGYGREIAHWPQATPLFQSLGDGAWRAKKKKTETRQGLSEGQVARIFKAFFNECADAMTNPLDAEHLRAATTHWLRHTFASLALEAGGALEEVQETLGHVDSATTALYTHVSRKRRKSAIDKLMGLVQTPAPG